MGKNPPKPTPASEMAGAQTGANFSTQMMNNTMGMMGINTPGASLSYNQTGTQTITGPGGEEYEVPMYEATTRLGSGMERIRRTNQRTSENTARGVEQLSTQIPTGPMDTSGLPGLMSSYDGADDFSADRQRVEDALMQRMQPGLDDDREALQTRLANQGIGIGSEAYGSAQDDFGRTTNDARLAAILGAGQEQQRMVGMSRDAAAFSNQARGQGFQERSALRAQPINEMAALRAGTAMNVPNFNPYQPGAMPTPNVSGMIAANDQANAQNWAARQSAIGSNIGGAGSLAYGLAMLSDARAKEGKKKIGETEDGLGIYSYRYKGSPRTEIGLMAQEVQKKRPEAIRHRPDGLMMVDYGEALG